MSPSLQGSKPDQKTIALAGMVTPDIITDLNRGVGAVFFLKQDGIIDEELFDQFTGCFAEVRQRLLAIKGLINVGAGR